MEVPSDTPAAVAHLATERHASMTTEERMGAASELYETARAIVCSSLPPSLNGAERRLAIARRFHGADVPDAMLVAYPIRE
jgi:hypothetical protein